MPAISIIKLHTQRFLSSSRKTLLQNSAALVVTFLVSTTGNAEAVYIPTKEELAEGQVEIIAGENKTVFEYRVNGRLLMIKVVPKLGASYYMVPADGQPHYESLDHKKKLYPQFVLIEF